MKVGAGLDEAALDELLRTQRPSGAFPSTVTLRNGPRPDENAFVTALVTLELLELRAAPRVRAACDRALDFLLSCEVAGRPGAFCFYPRSADLAWLGERLPPDVDDTALTTLALYRGGLRRLPFVRHVLATVLSSQRLRQVSSRAPSWLRPGVYSTWLSCRRRVNPVDLCVNLNVVTLIVDAGLQAAHPYAPIVAMVEEGIALAEADTSVWPQILPYYPHPGELVLALRRAVAAGAKELETTLKRAERAPWGQTTEGAPLCSSQGGLARWTSTSLALARARG